MNPIVAGVMNKEGRELCITDAAYSRRTQELADRQLWKCAICTRIMGFPTFDHEDGKGMGNTRQDDSLYHADGRWRNAALCLGCNSEKGSKRFGWRDGLYREVLREAA